MEKTEWFGYPAVKNILKTSLFLLTEFTNMIDGNTHTDTAWRYSHAAACIASRGKNWVIVNIYWAKFYTFIHIQTWAYFIRLGCSGVARILSHGQCPRVHEITQKSQEFLHTPKLGICEVSRFNSNSNRTSRFDSILSTIQYNTVQYSLLNSSNKRACSDRFVNVTVVSSN